MNPIMTKKYNSPMLQVVSVKKCDIICTSPTSGYDPNSNVTEETGIAAPGQRDIDSWYAGY